MMDQRTQDVMAGGGSMVDHVIMEVIAGLVVVGLVELFRSRIHGNVHPHRNV